MKQHIDELLARIETLQNELEEEYRQAREDWEQRKQELADEFLRQQRRYKTGLFRFLLRSRLLVILSAPVIYAGWIPFLLIDLFVTTYQAICFPIYRIPKVKRSDPPSMRKPSRTEGSAWPPVILYWSFRPSRSPSSHSVQPMKDSAT